MAGNIVLQPDSILEGKWYNKEFRVVKQLDSGGTASLYLVREIPTDREYAAKISEDITGIDREYRVLGKLDGLPYVPRVYCRDDCVIDGKNYYFFCMSYLMGKNLKGLFKGVRVPHRTALEIIIIIGTILDRMNRYNLYYCDIKPENIMFDKKTGCVCIIDFGGVVEKGSAITQFTPDFDRASWGRGERTADEGYQNFALMMMLLDFLMDDLQSCGRDYDRLMDQIDRSQLSKSLKEVIIKGLKQDSPSLKRLIVDITKAARRIEGEEHCTRCRVDILINIGLMMAIAIFVVVLTVVLKG